MTVTRIGAQAEEQQKAEQANINAANARSAAMTQMKSKVSNSKLKLVMLMNKLKVNLTDYRDTKDEVGIKTERDATVLLIQTNWPRLEAIANELNEAMTTLAKAVSTANDIELEGDPSTMIDNFRKEAMEAYQEYKNTRLSKIKIAKK